MCWTLRITVFLEFRVSQHLNISRSFFFYSERKTSFRRYPHNPDQHSCMCSFISHHHCHFYPDWICEGCLWFLHRKTLLMLVAISQFSSCLTSSLDLAHHSLLLEILSLTAVQEITFCWSSSYLLNCSVSVSVTGSFHLPDPWTSE